MKNSNTFAFMSEHKEIQRIWRRTFWLFVCAFSFWGASALAPSGILYRATAGLTASAGLIAVLYFLFRTVTY